MIELLKRLWMWLALREQEEMELNPLGFISDKYESGEGKLDSGTIADNAGDPGGKSYGTYQLSSNAGTLQRYLDSSKYREFLGILTLTSPEFDRQWRVLAEEWPDEFAEDQRLFIETTHYNPVCIFAKTQGFSTDERAIQEALFSIGVQHGGYRVIIKSARRIKQDSSAKSQVKALYKARSQYVQGLSTLSTQIKASVLSRYIHEEADVLELL